MVQMKKLKSIMHRQAIELIIWDFDKVIFELDWAYQNTPGEFLADMYEKIKEIDSTIVGDKNEFVTRKFPYPEINELGRKHGKQMQDQIKFLYKRKESKALIKAIPNSEVIGFIQESDVPQAIWSNNLSVTIEQALQQAGIHGKISVISSLDKVIKSKPHAEGFEIIRKKHPNIDRKNILMVGDSLRSDKVAAKNAGIGFYHYQK